MFECSGSWLRSRPIIARMQLVVLWHKNIKELTLQLGFFLPLSFYRTGTSSQIFNYLFAMVWINLLHSFQFDYTVNDVFYILLCWFFSLLCNTNTLLNFRLARKISSVTAMHTDTEL